MRKRKMGNKKAPNSLKKKKESTFRGFFLG